MTAPRRGEVYWVQLDPTVGSEIGKRRPAAIVSNDIGNRLANRVLVAPITTSTTRIYPFEVGVAGGEAGLAGPSKILLDQLRCVDKARLGERLGVLEPQTLGQLDRALHVSLDLRCPPKA